MTTVVRVSNRRVPAPPDIDETAFSALLSDFAGTLATDFPIQAILDRLVGRIVGLLAVEAAGVSLIGPDLVPRFIASSDAQALQYEHLQTNLGQGPCVTAYLTGEAVPVPDLGSELRFPLFVAAARAAGLAAVFSFPLRHPNGRFGALDLYRGAPGQLSPRALEVAQTLADVTSAYLMNAQSREEVLATSEQHRQMSLHDPLTGLPNRLLLQDRFEHATVRAQRSRASAAVLFIDIDDFKRINDTLGHQAGDQVLVAIAQRLSHQMRASDTLARIAGDEFVLLCEELRRRSDAELIRERVRACFAEPFLIAGTAVPVSASVGLAYAAPGKPISDHLVSEADRAMYRVKNSRK